MYPTRLSSESASSNGSSATTSSSISSALSVNSLPEPDQVIKISQILWNEIKPKPFLTGMNFICYSYKNIMRLNDLITDYGQKYKMGKNWSDIIAKHTEIQLKIGCVLKFNYKNKQVFGSASCRLCDCSMLFYTPDKEQNVAEGIKIIRVSFVRKPDPNKHDTNSKRKVSGAARQEIAKLIEKDKPLKYFEDLIIQNNGDGPLIPRLPVLRKIRSQKKGELKVCEDQIKAVRILNRCAKFEECVKYFLQEPFFALIFWLKSQEEIVENSGDYYIAIDATGSVAQNPIKDEMKLYERPPIKQKPVFLYIAILKSNSGSKSIPICQMLSQNHTSEFVTTWLKMFWNKSRIRPFEVRIDCSPTLMLSTSKTFNNLSTNEYLKQAYQSINDNKLYVNTIIRLDKSHVVKIFHNLKPFKIAECGKHMKFFYINVLKKFVEEKEFKKLQDITRHIFTVVIAEFESKEVIRSVNKICEYTGKAEKFQEIEEDTCFETKFEDDEDEPTLDDFWCTNLYLEVLNELTNAKFNENKLNPYFFPAIKSDLLRILKLTPMWTAVMVKLENRLELTCSSSCIESQFNIIKNIIFYNYKLPVRVDFFLELYLNHVLAQSLIYKQGKSTHNSLVSAERKTGTQSEDKQSIDQISSGTLLTCDTVGEEEWRGQNKKSTLSTFKSQLNVPMRSNSFEITVGRRSMQFYALCALNSLFHSIYFFCLKMNFSTKVFTGKFSSLIQAHLNEDIVKANQLMYGILCDFDEVLDFQTDSINCEIGIITALEKVILENITICCDTCKKSKSIK